MYRLGECELIYINQSKSENGSPLITTFNKKVKCSVMQSFSANYYQQQTRDMRNTKNILISKPLLEDVVIDGTLYSLEYVIINKRKYKIRNILINRKSAITSILDCDEVINV